MKIGYRAVSYTHLDVYKRQRKHYKINNLNRNKIDYSLIHVNRLQNNSVKRVSGENTIILFNKILFAEVFGNLIHIITQIFCVYKNHQIMTLSSQLARILNSLTFLL